ncbi:MAG: Wzz/FepE/Etk N-terminal domain-containing protein [Syntrophobacter sp.]
MQNSHPSDLMVPPSAALPASHSGYGNVHYAYAVEEEQDFHLRDYWHILLKRKWWFLGILSLVMVATALVTFLMTPVYQGKITLQIVQDNPSALMGGDKLDPLGAITGTSEMDRFYETQYKILQSPTLAYGLIDSLNLKEHPSYKEMERDNEADSGEVIRQKYAQALLLQIKVAPVKKSFLVDVSFTSTDK